MLNDFYKKNPSDEVYWKDTSDQDGLMIFSFDRKREFNLWSDYPWKLTPEEKELFDKENPYWAEFFSDRK